ncbi:uncharacterized protein LOC135475731 [Liolophura sinensis]|uniref:uncharacterized protein LOC135475731 n=1 Tax=Liolophura sinensis TaxID=3198878 RepID=UPI003157F70C
MRTSANLIVIFMCGVDLNWILHMVSINLVTGISGRWQYDRTSTCTYSAFMVQFSSKATGFSLCVISLNRLLMITRHELYHKVFRVKYTVAMLVFVLIASLVISLPVTVKGIQIYILYSDQTGSCFAYDADPTKAFQITNIFCAIILPSVVMIPSYTWIFCFVRRSKRRVAAGNAVRMTSISVKEELRSALVIFLSYITYCLFYVPFYGVYLTFLTGGTVSTEVLVASSFLTDFHRFIRPSLYPILGTSYRQALVRMFSSRSAQTSTTTTSEQQRSVPTNATAIIR